MTEHRKPCYPPTYDPHSAPGICRMCGSGEGMPKKKDGTPNGAVHYHSECSDLKVELFPATWWARRHVSRRDGEVCKACGEPECLPLELDHVIPLWSVDRTAPDAWKNWTFANLQLLGVSCHKKKTAREAKARAKTKRLNGTTKGPRYKHKIPSRGFQKPPAWRKSQWPKRKVAG